MADKVTFRGAKVRYYDGRHKNGTKYVRIHFTAELTSPVIEAMKWTDPGPSTTEAKLGGELVGTHMVLTPNDEKLAKAQIHLDVNKVDAFQLVTIEKDEVKRRELRFVVRSAAPEAAALVEGYVGKAGDFDAALVITYSVQESLPMQDAKPADGPVCVSCENSIAFTDDTKVKHVNGLKCKRPAAQVPVVALAAGDGGKVLH